MKTKLQIFHYRCGTCGGSFDAPVLAGSFNYGIFLLRSNPTDHLAIYNALKDPVYTEVKDIIREMAVFKNKSDLETADAMQKVFGVTFDTTEYKEPFALNAKPHCPHCKNNIIDYWEASDPAILIEYDLFEPTHSKWNGLSKNEKYNLIETALKLYSSEK